MSVIDIEVQPKEWLDPDENQERSAKEVVEHTRNIFKSGKTIPLSFRKQQLRNLIKFIDDNFGAICDAIDHDLRRHRSETRFETDQVKNEARNLLYNLDQWAKVEKQSASLAHLFDGVYVYKEPYGVVLVMGTWSFPFQTTLCPLAGAIAAGNCAIVKPSEISSASAEFLAATLPKYLDNDCYPVYLGGMPETTELLLERFDYIFFTGSTTTARKVHQAANRYLTPVTLELGGKNPVYIDDSVNMMVAARRIMWGKCFNSGQNCLAPDYVLCSEEVQKRFIDCAVLSLRELYTSSIRNSPYFARIVSEKQFNRLMNFMKDGRMAVGGICEVRNRFFHPSILVDVRPDDSVMQEEIFGPILPIMNVSGVDDAIRFINSKENPLVLYIFSNRKKDVESLITKTTSGGVSVNDTLLHPLISQLPYGGVGFSGMGAYHGKRSFDTFVHKKAVLKKGFNSALERLTSCRYPPYTDRKMTIFSNLTKERRRFKFRYLSQIVAFFVGVVVAFCICKICRYGSKNYKNS